MVGGGGGGESCDGYLVTAPIGTLTFLAFHPALIVESGGCSPPPLFPLQLYKLVFGSY